MPKSINFWDKKFVCPYCSKGFLTQPGLDYHVESKTCQKKIEAARKREEKLKLRKEKKIEAEKKKTEKLQKKYAKIFPDSDASVTNSPWYYVDPQGRIQGPFGSDMMRQWLVAGYFTSDLFISQSNSGPFFPMKVYLSSLQPEQERKRQEKRAPTPVQTLSPEAEASIKAVIDSAQRDGGRADTMMVKQAMEKGYSFQYISSKVEEAGHRMPTELLEQRATTRRLKNAEHLKQDKEHAVRKELPVIEDSRLLELAAKVQNSWDSTPGSSQSSDCIKYVLDCLNNGWSENQLTHYLHTKNVDPIKRIENVVKKRVNPPLLSVVGNVLPTYKHVIYPELQQTDRDAIHQELVTKLNLRYCETESIYTNKMLCMACRFQ